MKNRRKRSRIITRHASLIKSAFLPSQYSKPRHSRARGFFFLRFSASETPLVGAADVIERSFCSASINSGKRSIWVSSDQ
jgi:hypothetical protein